MDAHIQNAAAVAAFARCDVQAALNMPCDLYALCLRNALISNCEQTEEGRTYLKDAIRLAQTEPEYHKIRNMPGYQAEKV